MTRGLESAINCYMCTMETTKYSISPEDNNADKFSMFFVVDVSNLERIECPVFMIGHLIKTLNNAIEHNQHLNKIVVPIDIIKNQETYKTVDSLFKTMFEMGSFWFAKMNFKDNIVYGNRGVIINEIYQLLYCETLLLDYQHLRILEENIYIHPNVYKDSKNVIHKGITSRFMPFYIGKKRYANFGISDLGFCIDGRINSNVIFKEFPVLQKTSSPLPTQNPKEILQNQMQTLQNSMYYAS